MLRMYLLLSVRVNDIVSFLSIWTNIYGKHENCVYKLLTS